MTEITIMKLVVTVQYRTNGEDPETLKGYLAAIADDAASMGMFTCNSAAEVELWDSEVVEV